MNNQLNTDGLASKVAILKPTVVGAALRVYLLGGSALNEKQLEQAAGSAYLMRENGIEVMALVVEMESRTAAMQNG
jgi:hypothetical protein|tara:strand:+ start:7355 stop:7582 length:228 start_codon:yes stop_codon:yes gene_type:complete